LVNIYLNILVSSEPK